MKTRILLLLLGLSAATFSKAQDNDPSLGLGFFGAFPMNQLCDIDYDHGFGMNISYLSKRLRPHPELSLQWGLRMDFAAMDHRDFSAVVLNTPAVDMGDMQVRNSMYGFFGLARLNFGSGRFNPYIEGIIGHRNLHTKQVITAQNPSLNPDYEPATTYDRVVWTKRFAYGGSVGMTYRIGSGFYLESSITYTEGGEGAVMPLKNVSQNEQLMVYPHEFSETDMLLINVGVRFRLQKSSSQSSDTKSGPPSPTRRRYTDPDNSNDNSDDPPVSRPPKKKLETKPSKPKSGKDNS